MLPDTLKSDMLKDGFKIITIKFGIYDTRLSADIVFKKSIYMNLEKSNISRS